MGTSSFKNDGNVEKAATGGAMAGKKVKKAREPLGTKIQPQKYNADQGPMVGGWGDDPIKPGMAMSGTARRGQGPGAAVDNSAPSTNPPTPYPGQKGKAKPNAMAPTSLKRSPKAHGASPSTRAETTGRRMASLARTGGRKLPIDVQPTRHQQAALPTPTPTYPKATGPQGKAVPAPANSGGRMTGVMQSGRGKPSAGNKVQN